MVRSAWWCLLLWGCGASAPAEVSPAPAPLAVPVVEPSPPAPAPSSAVEALLAEDAGEPREDDDDGMRVTGTGLGITDLQVGSGPEVVPGDEVEVHYVGRLEDGSVFDESRPRGRPFVFEAGAGLVIEGWDEGILGMQVGGLRRLLVPPHLAYGARGAPPSIPPDAILEFEIELLGVR